MLKLLTYLLNLTLLVVCTQFVFADDPYNVVQSTEQGIYYFNNATLDGSTLEDGVHWIIAKNNDILVGAAPYNGSSQTEVVVMGEEQFDLDGFTCDSGPVNTCGMMLSGQIPQFYIFDGAVEIKAHYTAADGTVLVSHVNADGNVQSGVPAWHGNDIHIDQALNLVLDCNADMGGAAVNSGLCGDCWGGNTGLAENYNDTDNDGVCNDGAANGDDDNCPDTPNTNQADNDADETGDLCDDDDDNDGCLDDDDDASFEWDDDYDEDGTPDEASSSSSKQPSLSSSSSPLSQMPSDSLSSPSSDVS